MQWPHGQKSDVNLGSELLQILQEVRSNCKTRNQLMVSLKRRAFNQHLIDRICSHLANGQSLEKSSPDYEALCNYGIIGEEAA